MTTDPWWPVPCPRDYCGADVGEPCRSSMGNVTTTHIPRRDAAKEKGLECKVLSKKELAELKKLDKAVKARKERLEKEEQTTLLATLPEEKPGQLNLW